jgi:hypothetical protein
MTFDEWWKMVCGIVGRQIDAELLEASRSIARGAWEAAQFYATDGEVSGVHHTPESDHDDPPGSQRPYAAQTGPPDINRV